MYNENNVQWALNINNNGLKAQPQNCSVLYYTGKVFANVFACFLIWPNVAHSVTVVGSLFQILTASLMQVFCDRQLRPFSINLPTVVALVVGPDSLAVCYFLRKFQPFRPML